MGNWSGDERRQPARVDDPSWEQGCRSFLTNTQAEQR